MSVTSTPAKGGWYHGWTIVAITILSQITANGLAINSLSLFLHDWARDLHTPVSQLLLAIMPLGAVVAIASPVMGAMADKYPARWLFSLGLVGITLFSFAMSAVTATWQIWALYGTLLPISITTCTTIASNAVVSRWFVRHVGLALGLSGIGLGISGVILPPLIAAVMPDIGWRNVWRIAGLLTGLVVLPLVLWLMRDRPSESDGRHYLTATGLNHAHHGHGPGPGRGDLRWIDMFARPNFWLLVLCFIPLVSLYFGTQQNLAPIAASHGFGPKTAGMLLAVFALLHVVATPLLGWMSDRFGSRLLLAGLAVLAMVGAVLIGFGSSLPTLVAGVALIGFSGSVWALMAAAMVVEFGPDGVGRAFGALMLCLPLSSATGALIARAQEMTGGYGPPLLGLGLFCLVGGASVLMVRERTHGPVTASAKMAARHRPAYRWLMRGTRSLRPEQLDKYTGV